MTTGAFGFFSPQFVLMLILLFVDSLPAADMAPVSCLDLPPAEPKSPTPCARFGLRGLKGCDSVSLRWRMPGEGRGESKSPPAKREVSKRGEGVITSDGRRVALRCVSSAFGFGECLAEGAYRSLCRAWGDACSMSGASPSPSPSNGAKCDPFSRA